MSGRIDSSIALSPLGRRRVAIIGFGTRGQRTAHRLLCRGHQVAVFDSAFAYVDSWPAIALRRLPVRQHASVAGVVADCDIVIVTVPACAAIDVAREAADHLEAGATYLDATGCDAQVGRRAKHTIVASGANYTFASDPEALRKSAGLLVLSDLLALYRAPLEAWNQRLRRSNDASEQVLQSSPPAVVIPMRRHAQSTFAVIRGVAA